MRHPGLVSLGLAAGAFAAAAPGAKHEPQLLAPTPSPGSLSIRVPHLDTAEAYQMGVTMSLRDRSPGGLTRIHT